MHAKKLFTDVAVAYNINCERYPVGTAHAMIRVALPYSLKGAERLAVARRDGAGCPPTNACRATGLGLNRLLRHVGSVYVSQRGVSCDLNTCKRVATYRHC